MTRAEAERAREEDLGLMRQELERMQRGVQQHDIRQYLAGDMEFHRRVAQASQNAIIWQFVSNLTDLLEEVLQEAKFDEMPAQAEGGASHQDIYLAIADGDSQTAARAMRQHIKFTTEVWQTMVSLTAGKE
ncbi:MAG: FadR family transcriptional regulator [Anaerolineae bacterium]|nr:FadR family transcriptional regulator [Anaerolineae bacterium]